MGKENDPLPPKRPLAPFFLYKQDQYEIVKKEFPEKKMTELIQIIAERWKNVDATLQANYQKSYEGAKAQYEVAKKDHEDKYGAAPKKTKKSKNNKKK